MGTRGKNCTFLQSGSIAFHRRYSELFRTFLVFSHNCPFKSRHSWFLIQSWVSQFVTDGLKHLLILCPASTTLCFSQQVWAKQLPSLAVRWTPKSWNGSDQDPSSLHRMRALAKPPSWGKGRGDGVHRNTNQGWWFVASTWAKCSGWTAYPTSHLSTESRLQPLPYSSPTPKNRNFKPVQRNGNRM